MNCTGKRCIMQFDKVDPATCKCVSYCPQATPPKTNADRIRSMTDEELALYLDNMQGLAYINGFDSEPIRLYPNNYGAWLDWLRQEAHE